MGRCVPAQRSALLPETGQRLAVYAGDGPKLLVLRQAPAAVRDDCCSPPRWNWRRQAEASSLHWLFTTAAETDLLEQAGLVRRTGCQFHWENRGYADFDAFLPP